MRKIRFVLACFGIVLGLATPGHAMNLHSYVSANGVAGPCTLTAPCPSIGIAMSQTYPEGVVSCLDGITDGALTFFAITITQSITIDCAGVSATSWYVVINTPGVVVTLRNLTIGTLGAGIDVSNGIGINFQNGAALFVEHCVVEHWGAGSGIGILFAPPAGVTAKLHVSDSVIKNNGVAASGGGIIIQPSGSGSARVVIERASVENNTYGIFANGTGSTGSISLHIKDSMIANNVVNGISAYTLAGRAVTSIVVDRSSSLLNGGNGILAQGAGGFVTLSDSTVVSNVTGLSTVSGGGIFSYGNNRLSGNVSDGVSPTAGVFTLK